MARCSAARRRTTARWRRACSSSSASPTLRRGPTPGARAANASSCCWRARWRRSRNSWCWTSPPRASTSATRARSCARSARSPAPAMASSSPPMIPTTRCARPTAPISCAKASASRKARSAQFSPANGSRTSIVRRWKSSPTRPRAPARFCRDEVQGLSSPLSRGRPWPYIITMAAQKDDYVIRPDPLDPRLTERVTGVDQTGQAIETRVTVERALTIFLNSQEIVTAMTINDYPEYLALGYLLNQHMLLPDDVVTGVDYDEELAVVVVRTKRKTNYEKKLKKKVQTSGCAQGTVFGDLMDALENVTLPEAELRTSWLYGLTHKINTTPSLYLEAGAIHGCVLAHEDRPLVYMEDVGRHNAVDKIAGWMFKHGVAAHDKIFYTTGRLTSEMVIKTVRMGIPILVSRSGFTAWGVELARKANLTLVGRARGKRFVALAGEERIVFDQDLKFVEEESARHRRKAAVHDD